MNPANNVLLTALYADNLLPCMVDEVTEDLTYIGYCLPDCKGYDDPRWLIKRVQKTDTVQTIFYSGGSRLFDKRWTDRAELTYLPTEQFKAEEKKD